MMRTLAARHARWLAVLLALALLVSLPACAKDPTRPRPLEVGWGIPYIAQVDYPLAWSRDGQWIAFRRWLPSSYGPPGMYIVHRLGGRVRYVTGPADRFFPSEATFSADGRFIAYVADGRRQLSVVEIATGEVRHPMQTGQYVWRPDWSPDGRYILHSRTPSYPDTPNDSVGLHLFDVVNGTDRQMRVEGDLVLGAEFRWSPSGDRIAVIEALQSNGLRHLTVIPSDESGRRVLIPVTSGVILYYLHWYTPWPLAVPRIVFYRSSSGATPAGYYLINPDGTGLSRFWHRIDSGGYLSPAGDEYVRSYLDPSLRYGVLAVGDASRATDFALRPITEYIPTPP
jgi:dipeptidyl aminopeptidase/acylaminoacyl peptidase